MQPLLADGMLLELCAGDRNPARGDIAVFRAGDRLVAHRVVGKRGSGFVCCGDAEPDRTEVVDAADIVGVVRAVYRSDGSRMRRIDTPVFRARGRANAYLHPLRAFFERALPCRRERTYRGLVQAASAIVRGDNDALLEAIQSAAPPRMAAVARRHRMAAALCAALEPLQSDNGYARAIFALLRRSRWEAAAYMPPYRSQVVDVVRLLRQTGVDPVLLKGAARAFRREPGWQQHESSDIDVLVERRELERAHEALRQHGYAYRCTPGEVRRYRDSHHHLAPLYPPENGVYVELHHALHKSVAAHTRLADLHGYTLRTQDEGVDTRVFNRVGTALHYAIHAIDRPALRDVFLLAQTLASMTAQERRELQSALREMKCVQPAVRAALLVAAEMAGLPHAADSRTCRFAIWMLQREDLPRALRARPQCVDAWFGAHGSRARAVVAAACERRTFKSAAGRIAVAAAIALYLPFMR